MPHKKDGSPQAQNGGRPLGAATRLTRVRANEIIASGKTPLDVMIGNMTFWDRQAEVFTERLQELVDDGNKQGRKDHMPIILAELLTARDNAQRCAVEAAPYVHAKLQPISSGPASAAREIILRIPEPAVGEDRSYRDRYATGPDTEQQRSNTHTTFAASPWSRTDRK